MSYRPMYMEAWYWDLHFGMDVYRDETAAELHRLHDKLNSSFAHMDRVLERRYRRLARYFND